MDLGISLVCMQDGLGIPGWSCILAWELKHAKYYGNGDPGDTFKILHLKLHNPYDMNGARAKYRV